MQCKGIPSRGRGLRNNNEFVGRWFVGGRRFSRRVVRWGIKVRVCVCVGWLGGGGQSSMLQMF